MTTLNVRRRSLSFRITSTIRRKRERKREREKENALARSLACLVIDKRNPSRFLIATPRFFVLVIVIAIETATALLSIRAHQHVHMQRRDSREFTYVHTRANLIRNYTRRIRIHFAGLRHPSSLSTTNFPSLIIHLKIELVHVLLFPFSSFRLSFSSFLLSSAFFFFFLFSSRLTRRTSDSAYLSRVSPSSRNPHYSARRLHSPKFQRVETTPRTSSSSAATLESRVLRAGTTTAIYKRAHGDAGAGHFQRITL